MLSIAPFASNARIVVPAIPLPWNFPSHSRQVRDPELVSWVKSIASYIVREASKKLRRSAAPTIDRVATEVSMTTFLANAAAKASWLGRLSISIQEWPGGFAWELVVIKRLLGADRRPFRSMRRGPREA